MRAEHAFHCCWSLNLVILLHATDGSSRRPAGVVQATKLILTDRPIIICNDNNELSALLSVGNKNSPLTTFGVNPLGERSSRQCCECCEVKVLVPPIACSRADSISDACKGNDARSART